MVEIAVFFRSLTRFAWNFVRKTEKQGVQYLQGEYLRLFLVLTSFGAILCQLKEDWSLRKACQRTGGVYTRRASFDAATGDVCEMTFNVWTQDQQDADELCELYAPWRLQKATSDGHRTRCRVEATLMCEPGWTQMFGHCYRMPDKSRRVSREAARKMCKRADARADIAAMQHRYIPAVWRRHFTQIAQIWVRASETYEPFVKRIQKGDALALAIDGWHHDFKVMPLSLVRVDSALRMQVLCQYTPPVTIAEIRHVTGRYSEIYYPSVALHNGALVRSASHYQRALNGTRLATCRAILKPFLMSGDDDVEQMFPDDDVLEAMRAAFESDDASTEFYRTDAQVALKINAMHTTKCVAVATAFKVAVITNGEPQNLTVKFDAPEPRVTCDNMLSAAIVLRDGRAALHAMSDSQFAPIWCKLGARKRYRYTIPAGYTEYRREHNGRRVAHRLIERYEKWAVAQAECEKEGAVLSGADSLHELRAMEALVRKVDPFFDLQGRQVYLGGRRKPECPFHVRYDAEHPDGPCSRTNVMTWQLNAANQFTNEMWRDGRAPDRPNPDNDARIQNCVSLAVGKLEWADPNDRGLLDDISCDSQLWFFCEKVIHEEAIGNFS